MATFWSLVLEPGKKYEKLVENGIQVTRATLDTAKAGAEDGIVQVLLEHGEQPITIANLSIKHGIFQTPLDLMFEGGEHIAFSSSGAKVPVILTGASGVDDSDDEDEDIDSTIDSAAYNTMDDSEDEPDLVAAGTKRKMVGSSKQPAKAARLNNGKAKELTLNGHSFMSEDESDDDSYNPMADLKDDDNLQLLNEAELEEESEDAMEDSDDYEDIEDEEDEDDDDEEDVEEEEEAAPEPPKKQKKEAIPSKAAASAASLTPKQKDGKTPKKDGMTPKKDGKSPKKEGKTPKSEAGKTAKPESGKSPKADKKDKTPLKINNKENIDKTPKQDKKSKDGKKINGESSAQKTPKQMRTGGVAIEDLAVGTGPDAKPGQMISVYYNGKLKSNNKCFDKLVSGPPLKFRLGRGEVIKGWDVGVTGMKVGGKRSIMVPPSMGYGKKGAMPDIPPNSFLCFEVTLLASH